ncbi:MAG: YheC/YheD family protein [Firmicutes bacterium]|nr:YheC/YheD family protein [Bacillota bacterium]
MPRAVLGILTTYPDGSSVRGPRWPQWRSFAEIIRHGRKQDVLVYVFSPGGVDWRRRQVLGWRSFGQGARRWALGWFPMPDVVYNRVPSRTAERHPSVRACLRRFLALHGRVFNPHYLNKSALQRALGRHPKLSRHLPDTIPLTGPAVLRRFADTHRRVYLKAVGGSLGNGTMELARTASGWRLRYNPGPGRTRTASFHTWPGAWTAIQRITRGRPYLAQRAIALARADGRPFDLRLLVQKHPDGRWRFTGGAARVAGLGQITTHVPRGGRRMAMEEALAKAFGPEYTAEIGRQVADLAERAAAAMEAATKRRFIEMSMDLGIDDRGRMWIFELNAKPLRFDEPDIQQTRIAYLLDYVVWAAREMSPISVPPPGANAPVRNDEIPLLKAAGAPRPVAAVGSLPGRPRFPR